MTVDSPKHCSIVVRFPYVLLFHKSASTVGQTYRNPTSAGRETVSCNFIGERRNDLRGRSGVVEQLRGSMNYDSVRGHVVEIRELRPHIWSTELFVAFTKLPPK